MAEELDYNDFLKEFHWGQNKYSIIIKRPYYKFRSDTFEFRFFKRRLTYMNEAFEFYYLRNGDYGYQFFKGSARDVLACLYHIETLYIVAV